MERAAARDGAGGRHQAAGGPARPPAGAALARAYLEYRCPGCGRTATACAWRPCSVRRRGRAVSTPRRLIQAMRADRAQEGML
jgi:hypothetical protein